jgi:hypothetical protein
MDISARDFRKDKDGGVPLLIDEHCFIIYQDNNGYYTEFAIPGELVRIRFAPDNSATITKMITEQYGSHD